MSADPPGRTRDAWVRSRAVMAPLAVFGLPVLLALPGCFARARLSQPRPARAWPTAWAAAQQAAETGRYVDADQTLAAFAAQYPDSPEAREGMFWRALLKLDPANPSGSPRAAAEAFDAYLATRGGRPERRDDALMLRRIAMHLDSVQRAAPPPVAARSTPSDASADEVQKLRDELKRTQDELNRIKQRLAAPKP